MGPPILCRCGWNSQFRRFRGPPFWQAVILAGHFDFRPSDDTDQRRKSYASNSRHDARNFGGHLGGVDCGAGSLGWPTVFYGPTRLQLGEQCLQLGACSGRAHPSSAIGFLYWRVWWTTRPGTGSRPLRRYFCMEVGVTSLVTLCTSGSLAITSKTVWAVRNFWRSI